MPDKALESLVHSGNSVFSICMRCGAVPRDLIEGFARLGVKCRLGLANVTTI